MRLGQRGLHLCIRCQIRAVGGKYDHGNYIALAVAQLGQQIGAGALGERHVKHRKVEVAGLQRLPRLLDRIDCNDIANFAERASDAIVFVNVKDSRTSVRLVPDGLRERRTRRSKSTGLFSQSSTLSLDDRKSSRPRLGSPDTTMIGVSRYCGKLAQAYD